MGIRALAPRPLGGEGSEIAHLDERSGLPPWVAFTRPAGPWSRQTGPIVDAGSFIEIGSGADTPRFSYSAALGRMALLLEPARENVIGAQANFVDTSGGPDNVPDGWTDLVGGGGTNYTVVASGGPHGGAYFRHIPPSIATSGVFHAVTLAALTRHAFSVFTWRGGAGAQSVYAFDYDGAPQTAQQLALSAVAHTWSRESVLRTTAAVPGSAAYMALVGAPLVGELREALPQLEAGGYPTSFVAGARAAELLAVDPTIVPARAGSIVVPFVPEWATDEVTGEARIWTWGADSYVIYDGATDTIRIVNETVDRAESAALSWARDTKHVVRIDYGPSGTRVKVDGAAAVTDGATWVEPTLDPYLGSGAASADMEGAAYGNVILQAA